MVFAGDQKSRLRSTRRPRQVETFIAYGNCEQSAVGKPFVQNRNESELTVSPATLALPNVRMLLLLQKPRNTLLAILSHPGNDIHVNARLHCVAKSHPIRLVEHRFG
jgi:hypothetical protein